MVGLKAPGVRQLRHAEQVDLVRHDQGGPPAPGRPHMPMTERRSNGRRVVDLVAEFNYGRRRYESTASQRRPGQVHR